MYDFSSLYAGTRDKKPSDSSEDSGSSWGSGVGGAIGGALGSVVPGVGNLIGGMLGSTLGKLMSGYDDPSPYEKEQAKKKAEQDAWLKNVSNMKLSSAQAPAAPQIQSAPAAPQVMGGQSGGLPGVEDPEYYQKLAEQKYRSAMGG